MPQNPFAAPLAGLTGGRKKIASIQTPSMGIGQFYEDPSVTNYGLLNQQKDELRNRMTNEVDPSVLERLKLILGGVNEDIGESEAYMQNPVMEAGYAANLEAQRAGFPSSAAAGDYERGFEKEKMRIPIKAAETSNQGAFSRLLQTGIQNKDLAVTQSDLMAEREASAAENALQIAREYANSGRAFNYRGPTKSGGGGFGVGAAPRPQNTAPEAAAIRNELARLQIDNSRDPGSQAALNSSISAYLLKSGLDPEAQEIISDIIMNPRPGDENKTSDQLYTSDDPNDVIQVVNILRMFRGK